MDSENSLDAEPDAFAGPGAGRERVSFRGNVLDAEERRPLLSNRSDDPSDQTNAPVSVWTPPEGSSAVNRATYVLSCLFTVSFLVFLNAAQGFVLISVIDAPEDKLGSLSGDLALVDQLISLPCSYLWGAASDRFPRRTVFGIGFAIVSLALFLFPNMPDANALFAIRGLFALGGSACSAMMTAALGDHALPAVRGRLAGIVGTATGCGALLSVLVFLRVPVWAGGEGAVGAVKVAFYVVATVAAVWASVALVFLRPGLTFSNLGEAFRTNLDKESGSESVVPPAQFARGRSSLDREISTNQPNLDASDPLLRGLNRPVLRSHDILDSNEGLADSNPDLARQSSPSPTRPPTPSLLSTFRDMNIVTSYIGAFAARTASISLTLFLPLLFADYFYRTGVCPRPIPGDIKRTCHEAYLKASATSGVAQSAAIVAALIWGHLSDRVSKSSVLLLSSLLGLLGSLGMLLSQNPLSPELYLFALSLGLSEAGLIVGSLSLASTAPDSVRGSVAGIYSAFGAAGIMVTAKLGGLLFDRDAGLVWSVGMGVCAICGVAAGVAWIVGRMKGAGNEVGDHEAEA